MTGKDVAEQMLRDNGLYDVNVVATNGTLTDNYNPTNKTISLSEAVYHGDNVFAAAVAAHETGHAVQHAMAYAPLKMRSALVPVVSFSSQWVTWILLGGMLLMGNGSRFGASILLAGIGLFAMTTLFSFITLPVEINASVRALAWLNRAGITTSRNHTAAEGALKAAAYTYVVAALASLATLLYYVMIFLGGRRN
jgi:Zn-dependent membrane protease YugP